MIDHQDGRLLQVLIAWRARVISDRDALLAVEAMQPAGVRKLHVEDLKFLYNLAVKAGYRLASEATAPTGAGLQDGALRLVKSNRQLPKYKPHSQGNR